VRLLSIDTSSFSGSVAVSDSGRVLKEVHAERVTTHSEWLLKSIDELLTSLNLTINDIDCFAIGSGPGSFTGLRIGVSLIKGLAWATGKMEIRTVSTLMALSMNAGKTDRIVCPVFDARKKEVYAAAFDLSLGAPKRLLDDRASSIEDFIKSLKGVTSGRGAVFLGNGLNEYKESVSVLMPDAVFLPEEKWHIRASNIAILAESGPYKTLTPLEVTPLYLRKSEAELKSGQNNA